MSPQSTDPASAISSHLAVRPDWLASRKEAGKCINSATAKVFWEHGYVADP